jgi:hypothetical protein
VFILKEVKVLCFDTLLQVFILKGLHEGGFGGSKIVLVGRESAHPDQIETFPGKPTMGASRVAEADCSLANRGENSTAVRTT